MITTPLLYLLSVALLAALLGTLEKITRHKLFTFLPAVVLIYASAMILAQLGFWQENRSLHDSYKDIKTILLPAMLFVMLLQIDLKAFAGLGRSLIIAYVASVFSLSFAFIALFWLFSLNSDAAGVFATLAGSWTGGTANMLAVAAALDVREELMGYALIVDSIDYTLWVMTLLFLVAFAPAFNRWTKAPLRFKTISEEEERGTQKVQPLPLVLLFLFSLAIAYLSNTLAALLSGLSQTTWSVLFATLFGLIGSRTRLKNVVGSPALSSALLMFLIALIGSQAHLRGFSEVPLYLGIGLLILLLHALIMVLIAKLFRLDLFSIGVASLANIGGVASAPILAAAYHRSLIGIAVLMAIMGYMIGTFAGLAIGYILQGLAA
ncbi:MAG: DUF819 family protein [Helicobacteraceae bacterium]|jgi:uncharacterized membrane protein|nr:DUF819 family protein [Helicobacteraceae bacterium]